MTEAVILLILPSVPTMVRQWLIRSPVTPEGTMLRMVTLRKGEGG